MGWTEEGLRRAMQGGHSRIIGKPSLEQPQQLKAQGISLVLPYPPSSNTLYPTGGDGRRHLSKVGRAYHVDVASAVLVQWPRDVARPLTGRLAVSIWFYPPDRRRRDVDNGVKIVHDALTRAGAWEDDHQIKEVHLYWRAVVALGYVEVLIQEMKPC